MLIVQAVRFGGPEALAVRQAPDPVAGTGGYAEQAALAALASAFRGTRPRQAALPEPPAPSEQPAQKVHTIMDARERGKTGLTFQRLEGAQSWP